MFIADEGAQWWSQDYSQIEYRFLVHYSIVNKCPGFEIPQALYLKDPKTDFHDMCTKLMYGKKGPNGALGWDGAGLSPRANLSQMADRVACPYQAIC